MKLHPQATSAFYNTFTAYGEGYVEVNQARFESGVFVMPEGVLEAWPVAGFAELSRAHFEAIARRHPEVVIFGSGTRLRFPAPALLAPLIALGIGVETMDTHAACRTYNVLMAEGRKVGCALIIESVS